MRWRCERNPQVLQLAAAVACSAIFLVRGVGDYLANYFPSWVGRQVIKAIRGDLFAQYLRLPTARYDRESIGDDADAPDLQRRAGGLGRPPTR